MRTTTNSKEGLQLHWKFQAPQVTNFTVWVAADPMLALAFATFDSALLTAAAECNLAHAPPMPVTVRYEVESPVSGFDRICVH